MLRTNSLILKAQKLIDQYKNNLLLLLTYPHRNDFNIIYGRSPVIPFKKTALSRQDISFLSYLNGAGLLRKEYGFDIDYLSFSRECEFQPDTLKRIYKGASSLFLITEQICRDFPEINQQSPEWVKEVMQLHYLFSLAHAFGVKSEIELNARKYSLSDGVRFGHFDRHILAVTKNLCGGSPFIYGDVHRVLKKHDILLATSDNLAGLQTVTSKIANAMTFYCSFSLKDHDVNACEQELKNNGLVIVPVQTEPNRIDLSHIECVALSDELMIFGNVAGGLLMYEGMQIYQRDPSKDITKHLSLLLSSAYAPLNLFTWNTLLQWQCGARYYDLISKSPQRTGNCVLESVKLAFSSAVYVCFYNWLRNIGVPERVVKIVAKELSNTLADKFILGIQTRIVDEVMANEQVFNVSNKLFELVYVKTRLQQLIRVEKDSHFDPNRLEKVVPFVSNQNFVKAAVQTGPRNYLLFALSRGKFFYYYARLWFSCCLSALLSPETAFNQSKKSKQMVFFKFDEGREVRSDIVEDKADKLHQYKPVKP
jgi:hypothetical protein